MRRNEASEQLPESRLIKPSLGVLGRKWALSIVTDIGFRKIDRFSTLIKSNGSLTPRVLSRRLRELEEGGILFRKESKVNPRTVQWALTAKGTDILPFLMQLTVFSARWETGYVFKGRVPTLKDGFNE